MPASISIQKLLQEGRHRLSLGRVCEVVEQVSTHPRQAEQLVTCLWDDDPGVVNRAAQAVELLSRKTPHLFQRWKAELLGQLAEATEKKLRWSLAASLPRLQLTAAECLRVAGILQVFLDDTSSIVKTCALQGLADLAVQHPPLLPMALDLLRIHGRSGTPAMRARSHNLLKRIEKTDVAKDL